MKSIKQLLLILLCTVGFSYTLFAQQEVTNSLTRQYEIDLTTVTAPGGVKMINWVVETKDASVLDPGIVLAYPNEATTNADHHIVDITWDGTVGKTYVIKATLLDGNDCLSEAVSQEVIILPSDGDFMFADATDITVCSYNGSAETKSFDVTYAGVKPWKLYYKITDKDGTVRDNLVVQESGADKEFTTSTGTITIDIDNFFINNDATDQDWTVELIKAVSVADGHETMPKGANLAKTIIVHPLPVINGTIVLK